MNDFILIRPSKEYAEEIRTYRAALDWKQIILKAHSLAYYIWYKNLFFLLTKNSQPSIIVIEQLLNKMLRDIEGNT